ncbi:hypothetical protein V1283_007382 [Bradyrhizobium sp. AZCC 2262]|uniref:hypothetical protein n=1 Tax=Bradyrhizobium sp. AZCC 2262 TaxID=3117022 RepID=UPI002FF27B2F
MSHDDDLDRRKMMDWVRPDIAAHGIVVGMLATTFEFDPTFFDSDYLPTFLGLGAWEDTSWSNRVAMQRALAQTESTVVMMDARRFRGRPRSLHIEHMPLVGPGGRKLHAKVLLVVQERAVRLLIGSANLTEAGYRHNREVTLPILATAQTPCVSALVQQALTTMEQPLRSWWTLAAEQVRNRALDVMSDWRKQPLDDDHFVWSWGEKSLATEFVRLWPEEKIVAVTIVSPFWSDKGDQGPIAQLLTQFGDNKLAGAKIRLLTEASPESQSSFRPKLPAELAAWDVRRLGMTGEIQAVDPFVMPAEVGGRTDFQSVRALHAKVVVVEGPSTTMAYVGSANFTEHGWGFAGARSNIEAGVVMLRRGRERQHLTYLIPKATGQPIPLDGNGRSAVTPPEKSNDDLIWPTFIHDIRLVPVGNEKKQLQLELTLVDPKQTHSFSVSLLGAVDLPLLNGRKPKSGALEPNVLEQLLRDQRVSVLWSSYSVEFPVNVDLEARLLLPISPGAKPPGESVLLAYYQGKISIEDIYPRPPDEPGDDSYAAKVSSKDESAVDTTRIQSYQVREFVEALQGIHDDLRAAARSTETGMKHALLGEVSPLTLAREVIRAVHERRRSPTAAGFQLVEILACFAQADSFDVPTSRVGTWRECLARARKDVEELLSNLIEWNGGELKSQRAFHRYRSAILKSGAHA